MKTYFNNRVIWVTGASSGIGKALVEELAKCNAKIVLSARNAEKLEQIYTELNLNTSNGLILPMDIGAIDLLPQQVNKVIQHFGKIDMLINNAGISYRGIAVDTLLSVDRKIMEVNYFGTIALTKAVLPFMLKQKSGHIAVTSSIAGIVGTQIRSAYAASKFALHGFYDSLRMEVYQQNIRVTIVCPGFVKTDISINAMTENGSKYNILDPLTDKGMHPNECAKKYLKSMEAGSNEVVIANGRERIVPILKRYSPALLTFLLKRLEVK